MVGWGFVPHPAVRKVCFTGSTEVGKRIMAGCAAQVKRVTFELGGKSANIVFGPVAVVVPFDAEAGAVRIADATDAADAADAGGVHDMDEAVVAEFGRVDVCCNNAGIAPPDGRSILETGPEAWRRVQEVNLTSVYLCCKYAIPHPGPVNTTVLRELFAKDPEQAARRLVHVPMGRFAEPGEIATAYVPPL